MNSIISILQMFNKEILSTVHITEKNTNNQKTFRPLNNNKLNNHKEEVSNKITNQNYFKKYKINKAYTPMKHVLLKNTNNTNNNSFITLIK